MENRIKIVHITYSLEHGGAEVMILDLLRGLDHDVFEVSVCSLQSGGSLRGSFEASGIPVFDIEKSEGKDVTLPFRLYRFFKKQKPDIVHAHNGYMWLYSALPSKLAGARIVYTEHSVWEKPSLLYLTGSKVSEQITDCIVVPSKYVKELLSKKQHVNPRKIEVVYNGVDVARMKGKVGIQSKRKELGLNLNGKIIGIVARLVPVKNHKVLIEAMRIVCSKMNTCLLVVGDGELRGSLEELASQAGLKKRILFLGNRNDVDEILQDLDLFVLPSISEGFPISILEAMAAGVPIVANAVGGIPEALEQGRAGLLINCRDPQGLAQGIIDLLIDSSQASSFREAAMRRVTKDFSLGVMAGKYSDIYKELVEKREMT